MKNYYVYDNWTNKYAKIHKASCGFCNGGKGSHKDTSDTNGQWSKSFKNKQEAELAAQNTRRKTISPCSRCM